jgi:hypothetical protein
MHHFTQNNMLEPLQSVYCKGHSTKTALLKVTTDIRHSIGQKEVVVMALLDLSAAFDTADMEVLSFILSSHGVTGLALQWLQSYLSDREQVVVNGSKSPPKKLLCGVPQGSVLACLVPCCSPSTRYCSQDHSTTSISTSTSMQTIDLQLYICTKPELIADAVSQLEYGILRIQRWMNDQLITTSNSTVLKPISSYWAQSAL